MKYQTMKCKDCVLKHIANAMSYAKEILSGHGIGGTPDHRPDYLGELVNAENHLQHISADFLNRLMVLRSAAQVKRMTPSESDIDDLRELWLEIEDLDVPTGDVNVKPIGTFGRKDRQDVETTDYFLEENFPGIRDEENVAVVPDELWDSDPERLEIFLRMAAVNAEHGNLFRRAKDIRDYKGKYVWVFPKDVFIARKTDMRIPVSPGLSEGRRPSFTMRLVRTETLLEAIRNNPAKTLCALIDSMDIGKLVDQPEERRIVVVDRKPCCTIKNRLRTEPFVKVTDAGWPYMKKIWDDMTP